MNRRSIRMLSPRIALLLPLLAAAGCAPGAARSADSPECADIRERIRQAVALPPESRPRMEERAPRMRDRRRFERMLADSTAVQPVAEEGPAPVVMRMRVTPAGTVDTLLVVQTSGSPYFDRIAAGSMRRMEFVPASVDRCPVAVWIQIPVTPTGPGQGQP